MATGPVVRLRRPPYLLSSIAAVNATASRIYGYAPMLSPGTVRELQQEQWLCDNTSFSRYTGWSPVIRLAQGIDELFRAIS